ncbi:hypothetical protein FISHEDRAFT_71347 [Fistulina hepatica ATCC 64428]|nr:hypothetical protein FISHEDRAFT_71347 [Fistulina hepatica ATCC 64428]
MEPSQHSYATRIRQNVPIKLSARVRQLDPDQQPPHASTSSPEPSLSPAPTVPARPEDYPQFPPPDVVLHPDDATSKVFLAIGRSFLSVDNRAMTIKDLADMVLHFGLNCQNTSAASQAITTYIRSHLARCDAQQDHPLLLQHTLSGTRPDDDLLPALYSKSGGAHMSAVTPDRLTNFRRGTQIWYLSKAAGAECPFKRVGIRLCDYAKGGRLGLLRDTKEKKRKSVFDPRGQKRKRTLRNCHTPSSDSEEESVREQPPSKIQLTGKLCLRLKPVMCKEMPISSPPIAESTLNLSTQQQVAIDPSVNVEGEQLSDKSCLPPYPRRPIDIPLWTPTYDGPYPDFSWSRSGADARRSPSLSYSLASSPPESDESDEEYEPEPELEPSQGFRAPFGAFASFELRSADFDFDADDSEGEGDTSTLYESPGPRSPSMPAPRSLPTVNVKEEPTDVQGLLDAWDEMDMDVGDSYRHQLRVKTEHVDSWDRDVLDSRDYFSSLRSGDESPIVIKQEDVDDPLSLLPSDVRLPPLDEDGHVDSFSTLDAPQRASAAVVPVQGSTLFGPLSAGANSQATIRPRSRTVPFLSFVGRHASPTAVLSFCSAELSASLSTPSFKSLIQSTTPTALSTSVPVCVSPQETTSAEMMDTIVVHTCQPCNPPIYATQVEGISVYRMTLAAVTFLRRIDTDFVNLSPIANYSGSPYPVLSTVAGATMILRGSTIVMGMWVPLAAAQAYLRDHPPAAVGIFDTFLSDSLSELFPPALADFARHDSQSRAALAHFGAPFLSTLDASQLSTLRTDQCSLERGAGECDARVWDAHHQQYQQPVESGQSTSSQGELLLHSAEDSPLSPTEEEIFQALCASPEWEQHGHNDNSASSAPFTESPMPIDASSAALMSPLSEVSDFDIPTIETDTMHVDAPLPPPAKEPVEVQELEAPVSHQTTSSRGESSHAASDVSPQPPEASESGYDELSKQECSLPMKVYRGRARRETDKPLRRSKRVADMANSRTRSSQRGSSGQ